MGVEIGDDLALVDAVEPAVRADPEISRAVAESGVGGVIQVEAGPASVHVRYRDREWLFPRGDCVLLPIENTTAELLARYIGQRLLEDLQRQHGARRKRGADRQ